ncbi:MAG: hypothetical protein H7833_10570 [Magnetococcus sp. DMHC-1]|nr:hypothetical protein [Magnetococcales bacterium]
MSDILVIDTNILLNILDVPSFNQNRDGIVQEYNKYTKQRNTFFLPMATILETGSHVADIRNGQDRRKWGNLFVKTVTKSIEGVTPWKPFPFPTLDSISLWLDEFPDHAMSGIGFADLSIIKDWEIICKKFPMTRVKIWSLDHHLAGYDSQPGS